jgi:hypothetical protein
MKDFLFTFLLKQNAVKKKTANASLFFLKAA